MQGGIAAITTGHHNLPASCKEVGCRPDTGWHVDAALAGSTCGEPDPNHFPFSGDPP
jgi:hypothetical protein